MVDSPFITDEELDRYAEEGWLELQLILVSKFEDFFLGKSTVTLTVGEAYQLPTDFLKFRGIRHTSTTGSNRYLRRIDLKEIPYVTNGSQAGRPTHYFIRGNFDAARAVVELYPSPDSAYSVELFYTPLRSLRDAFAGSLRLIAGVSEYIILTMAIKMRDKEESDCEVLITERAMYLQSIEKALTPLDEGEPFAVVQQAGYPGGGIYDDPFADEY